MERLPTDIISIILSRLPVKSLLSLKCVCKSWLTLICSPEFAHIHLRQSLSSNTNRTLIFAGTTDSDYNCIEEDAWFTLYSFNLDFPKSAAVKLPLPWKFQTPGLQYPDIDVIGSCNGLLCLLRRSSEVILLNPETMSFFEFPEAPYIHNCAVGKNFGFGYDPLTDDYKIVRILDIISFNPFTHRFEISIYSFKLKSWRLIRKGVRVKHFSNTFGVLINSNLLHWTFLHPHYSKPPSILYFDLSKERWGRVPIPEYLESGVVNRFDLANLGNLDGCLCLLARTYVGERKQIDVWVMKEYGVKESWMKLLDVWHSNVTRWLEDPPLAFSRGGHEILLKKNDKHFRWYNLKHKRLRKTKIRVWPKFFNHGICWRSLVSIPDGQQFGAEMLQGEEVGSQLH